MRCRVFCVVRRSACHGRRARLSRPHSAKHHSGLFFILNKIDYLTEPERAVAAEFLHRALREHIPDQANIRIFSVSARRALEAKQAGDAGRLAESGLPSIESYLAEFLAREKTAALRQAVMAKAAGLLDAAATDIALAVRTLELPIEDLQARAASIRRSIA